jgi:hypothetical protein
MAKQMSAGGNFALRGALMTLNRVGYGAMQLAGLVWGHVWGPPRDVEGAIAVL